MQERRILVRVEQVERLVAEQPLFGVDEIEGEIQRPLLALANPEVRRESAEMHADLGIGLAVHDQGGREFHVGMIEVGELGLPVLVREVEEQRAEDGRLVERLAGESLDVSGLEGSAGLRRRRILPTETARRAEAGSASSAFRAFLLDGIAGRLTLRSVQPAIVVFVKLLDELAITAHRPTCRGRSRGAVPSAGSWPRPGWVHRWSLSCPDPHRR